MQPLTPRQAQILELIRHFMAKTGYPPTRSEIAAELGFRSANAAEQHLRALAKKGYLTLQPGASRGIRLSQDNRLTVDAEIDTEAGLPVIGRVAAGSPLLAEAHVDRYCQISAGLFTPGADYLLKVSGMSMRDAGILDGDLLAVHRTTEVRDGQIVVARIDNEVTVKRFARQAHRVQLLPENPEFTPIEIDLRQQELAIEGIGVGVIRSGL
ncbi:MAG: transcriptional repressor LexA [Spiribacter sp.]|jgi:repressor LexA|nr:transcriptional repressor LexA [Spiribacter sp.]MDR9488910.1 transcriptional repressor LexA [Spiribacter sp.]